MINVPGYGPAPVEEVASLSNAQIQYLSSSTGNRLGKLVRVRNVAIQAQARASLNVAQSAISSLNASIANASVLNTSSVDSDGLCPLEFSHGYWLGPCPYYFYDLQFWNHVSSIVYDKVIPGVHPAPNGRSPRQGIIAALNRVRLSGADVISSYEAAAHQIVASTFAQRNDELWIEWANTISSTIDKHSAHGCRTFGVKGVRTLGDCIEKGCEYFNYKWAKLTNDKEYATFDWTFTPIWPLNVGFYRLTVTAHKQACVSVHGKCGCKGIGEEIEGVPVYIPKPTPPKVTGPAVFKGGNVGDTQDIESEAADDIGDVVFESQICGRAEVWHDFAFKSVFDVNVTINVEIEVSDKPLVPSNTTAKPEEILRMLRKFGLLDMLPLIMGGHGVSADAGPGKELVKLLRGTTNPSTGRPYADELEDCDYVTANAKQNTIPKPDGIVKRLVDSNTCDADPYCMEEGMTCHTRVQFTGWKCEDAEIIMIGYKEKGAVVKNGKTYVIIEVSATVEVTGYIRGEYSCWCEVSDDGITGRREIPSDSDSGNGSSRRPEGGREPENSEEEPSEEDFPQEDDGSSEDTPPDDNSKYP